MTRTKVCVIILLLILGIVVIAPAAGLWQRVWLEGNNIEAEASPVVVETLNDIELIGCVRKVCVYAFTDDGDRCRLAIFSPFTASTRIDLECP